MRFYKVIKGFLVIHEGGNPIYTYFKERAISERDVLISGFLTAIQSFAQETMLSPDGGTIQSIQLSQTMLTFKLLIVRNTENMPIQYFFVILTDLKKSKTETDLLLEYLSLNFLNYDGGGFRREMRKINLQMDVFKEFDDFINNVIDLKWKNIKKKIKPIAGSLIQGLLNELPNHLPFDQILNLHPKIVRLGPTYSWLSDDLSPEEEEDLLKKIDQRLSHLYGKDLYDSLVKEVQKQLRMED